MCLDFLVSIDISATKMPDILDKINNYTESNFPTVTRQSVMNWISSLLKNLNQLQLATVLEETKDAVLQYDGTTVSGGRTIEGMVFSLEDENDDIVNYVASKFCTNCVCFC